MKTIKQHFETLPEPIRTWAFTALNKSEKKAKLSDKKTDLKKALWDSCYWNDSDHAILLGDLFDYLRAGKSLSQAVNLVKRENPNLFGKSSNNHPLIITKQTKTRGTKKYYTWQMSKNKKVVNHQYNSAPGRNKQLAQFIEDIRNGNFEIK